MDNRKLTPKELEILRIKAVESVTRHGLTQIKACEIFGFSQTSMCKYMKEYKDKKEQSFIYKKRGAKLGSQSKLNELEKKKLVEDILSNTPDELGLDYTLWNSSVVQEYIKVKYSINYHRRSVRKIMTKLGFSAQKPIKLAYQRNPEKMELWLSQTYPEIKARAMKEGARIYVRRAWCKNGGLKSLMG